VTDRVPSHFRYTPTPLARELDRLILERGACPLCSSLRLVEFHPSHACPVLRETDL
jgi:hypothetical protein